MYEEPLVFFIDSLSGFVIVISGVQVVDIPVFVVIPVVSSVQFVVFMCLKKEMFFFISLN